MSLVFTKHYEIFPENFDTFSLTFPHTPIQGSLLLLVLCRSMVFRIYLRLEGGCHAIAPRGGLGMRRAFYAKENRTALHKKIIVEINCGSAVQGLLHEFNDVPKAPGPVVTNLPILAPE